MDILYFSSLLADYYTYALAGAVIVMLFYIRRIDRFHKFLFFYLCIMLFMEVLSHYVAHFFKTNHIVLSLYALTELCFFSVLYRRFFLKGNLKNQLLITVISALYILAEFLYYFVFNDFNPQTYQPYCKVAENIVVLLTALNVLNSGVFANDATAWSKFWFNVVIITFFTLDTVFFLPFNFFVNAPLNSKFVFWIVHLFSVVLFYGYFTSLVFKNILSLSRTLVFNDVSKRSNHM